MLRKLSLHLLISTPPLLQVRSLRARPSKAVSGQPQSLAAKKSKIHIQWWTFLHQSHRKMALSICQQVNQHQMSTSICQSASDKSKKRTKSLNLDSQCKLLSILSQLNRQRLPEIGKKKIKKPSFRLNHSSIHLKRPNRIFNSKNQATHRSLMKLRLQMDLQVWV